METEYLLGKRLRAARLAKGWSQVELGKRSGIYHMTLSRVERGDKQDVNGMTVYKLAQALGVSADYLLGLTDEASSSSELEPAVVA